MATSAESADLEHHLVGHRAPHAVRLAVVPLGADRPTDGDRTRPEQLRCLGVGRLNEIRAHDPDRKDRATDRGRETSRTGSTLVQDPVPATRSLGEDAEQLSAVENLDRDVERSLALLSSGAIDRDHPHHRKEELRLPGVHVLRLADEGDVARCDQHQESRVEERDVVGTKDRRTRFRKTFEARHLDVPETTRHR